MMKSVLAILVIFLCTNQELVDGTPVAGLFKKVYSNTLGRLVSKNKSSTYQDREADYSNVENNSMQLGPTYTSESEIEVVSDDAVDYSEYLKQIKATTSKATSKDEQKHYAEEFQAIYNNIHNAPGAVTEVEFNGEKTRVNIGAKGTEIRLKNEADTQHWWDFLLDIAKAFWNLLRKVFYPKKEKKPGVNTSKEKIDAGKGSIPGRPASIKKETATELFSESKTDPQKPKELDPLQKGILGTDQGDQGSRRDNAIDLSSGIKPPVPPVKPEPHGDGQDSNGAQVHDSEEERKKKQDEKEGEFIQDTDKGKIKEEEHQEQEDLIGIARNTQAVQKPPAAEPKPPAAEPKPPAAEPKPPAAEPNPPAAEQKPPAPVTATPGTEGQGDLRTMDEYFQDLAKSAKGNQDPSKSKEGQPQANGTPVTAAKTGGPASLASELVAAAADIKGLEIKKDTPSDAGATRR